MIALVVALFTLLLHASTASQYGYFRDELYFIACAHHFAWGYVDQPPLVALAAWLALPTHENLLALRALPILAAALSAGVAVRIARELGGGRYAQWVAGIAVALLPAYLLLGNTLTTTSFEGLSWILAIWCALHIARGEGWRWWAALAASISFGLYGKYSIVLLVIALAVGFLCTRERRRLITPWLPIATALTLLALAPNIAWQWAHGWPMLAVLRGDDAHRHAFNTGIALEYRNLWSNALAFATEQLIYTNPIAAPIWLAGIVAPFCISTLRNVRFLSVAYVALFLLSVALGAKGYYIIGSYGALLAVGAVTLARAGVWLRSIAIVAVTIVAVATLPISLPILPVYTFIAYTQHLGLTGRNGAAHLIQPVYAEEFGWKRLARDVARVYFALPAQQRALTGIYADTYADAGAIDFFGAQFGLPSAIGSQNSYYLWGTHGYDGSSLIAIGATRIAILKRYYGSVVLVATSDEPLKWVVEGPSPIYLCTHPIEPLAKIWPNLRWYGA